MWEERCNRLRTWDIVFALFVRGLPDYFAEIELTGEEGATGCGFSSPGWKSRGVGVAFVTRDVEVVFVKIATADYGFAV